MESAMVPRFRVSDFLAVVNQSLDMAFGVIEVEGEVSSFKVNHHKYVFFDLKDSSGTVSCFMTVWQLRTPIEDGMRIIVTATPKLTDRGKFSLTVQAVRLVGKGNLLRSFELLHKKLADEGLFDETRKRPLPKFPKKVAVISSVQAAGYADFMKIAEERWGGVHFVVANVQVQGQVAAVVQTDHMEINDLGGTIKCGKIIHQITDKNHAIQSISSWILRHYSAALSQYDGKITLGISAYSLPITARQVQKIGITLKSSLKRRGINLRLIPNPEPSLSTASSHNNKLGLSPKKIEILLVRIEDDIYIAESHGAQNITLYARRDRERPRRDAFVGMLPPKLAQMMINLATGNPKDPKKYNILDPFCGTGTVLQEALLKGYCIHGSDLSQKMVDYTIENLKWLQRTYRHTGTVSSITQGDATKLKWAESKRIDAVICETYLGQPFSAPPKPEKLTEVVGNCNHIITGFLSNINSQLTPGTRLCIAVPAWRDTKGKLTHLPLLKQLDSLGYQSQRTPLLYYRPDQVVAREILLLKTL